MTAQWGRLREWRDSARKAVTVVTWAVLGA